MALTDGKEDNFVQIECKQGWLDTHKQPVFIYIIRLSPHQQNMQ